MALPYFDDNFHITGPYLNKNQGRRFVTITDKSTGKISQKTYAKYLMENHLGRQLSKEETVDHIDRDKLNDVIENLQILSASKHAIVDNKRVYYIEVQCIWCGILMTRSPRRLREMSKAGCAGPFCKTCTGKYRRYLQNGGERLPEQPFHQSDYFLPEKK